MFAPYIGRDIWDSDGDVIWHGKLYNHILEEGGRGQYNMAGLNFTRTSSRRGGGEQQIKCFFANQGRRKNGPPLWEDFEFIGMENKIN
jgi:hypothetical protein